MIFIYGLYTGILIFLVSPSYSYLPRQGINKVISYPSPSFISINVKRQDFKSQLQSVTTINTNDYNWKVIPDIWETLSKTIPNEPMLVDNIHDNNKKVTVTFSEANKLINDGSQAFHQLGICQGDCVSIFAENSHKWFILEQSIMKAGGCNAVRGASADVSELVYILQNSKSVGVILDSPDLLDRLFTHIVDDIDSSTNSNEMENLLNALKFVIVIYSEGNTGIQLAEVLSQKIKKIINKSNLNINIPVVKTYEELLTSTVRSPDSTISSRDGTVSSTAASTVSSTVGSPDSTVSDTAASTVSSPDSTVSSPAASTVRSTGAQHEVATLIYTSGTTSSSSRPKPKGVMLTHANLLYQVTDNSFCDDAHSQLNPQVGDVSLSILPCWHVFERTAMYYCLARGACVVYTNLRSFKPDLVKYKPHYLIAVPRLYETVYKGAMSAFKQQPRMKRKLVDAFKAVSHKFKKNLRIFRNLTLGSDTAVSSTVRSPIKHFIKRAVAGMYALLLWPLFKLADIIIWKKVRASLGGRIKLMVSGGSSLPMEIDEFFDMASINLLVGYGLSETSPVLFSRKVESNVLGSIGTIVPGGTTYKIKPFHPHSSHATISDKTSEEASPVSGVLWVKGPGVMKGYMGDEKNTRAAMDEEGYFNTGDLVRYDAITGNLVLTGRAKDTIVLLNGENVEPQSIEDAISVSSSLIDQAMLVGQDQRFLSAIIVLNKTELEKRGLLNLNNNTGNAADIAQILNSSSEIKEAVQNEVNQACMGQKLRPWEKVSSFVLTLEPFTVSNNQLTQTLKVKRHVVATVYEDQIKAIYTKKN